ncbi:MAG TPA: ABC transporter permease subunit, partial [Pirellulales bacterium]|nr:ABC transporter permease subunit [Pirellulales bacterium]
VYLTNLIELGAFGLFLKSLPQAFEDMAGVSFSTLATPLGRLAMAYVHPVVTLGALTWAVARGSDVVSGEVGRGTMEMLLAQPVRRSAVMLVPSAITVAGAAGLAGLCWLGQSIGIATVALQGPVDPVRLAPGPLNLFGYMVFLAGVSTMLSACDSQRWRTIGIVGAFYAVELVAKLAAQLAPALAWLSRFSFLSLYDPHVSIISAQRGWHAAMHDTAWLVALGVLAYVVAVVVFSRRDLPAPI